MGFDGRSQHGERGLAGGRRRIAVLVAAGTRERLARHRVGEGAHRLHGSAAGVERLKEQRQAGRHAEVSRAVRFHRHRAENKLARVFRRDAEHGIVHLRLDLRHHRDEPELLYRTARDAIEAVVNILHQHLGLLRAVGRGHCRLSRRLRSRRDGHRRDAGNLGVAVEQFLVAEGVEQVKAHGVARVLFVGRAAMRGQLLIGPADEEVFLGQRPGVGVVVAAVRLGFREAPPRASGASAARHLPCPGCGPAGRACRRRSSGAPRQ